MLASEAKTRPNRAQRSHLVTMDMPKEAEGRSHNSLRPTRRERLPSVSNASVRRSYDVCGPFSTGSEAQNDSKKVAPLLKTEFYVVAATDDCPLFN